MNYRKPYLVYSQKNINCIFCKDPIKKGDTIFRTPKWEGKMCIECFDSAEETFDLEYEFVELNLENNDYCGDCGLELIPDDTCIKFGNEFYHFECGFTELIRNKQLDQI